MMKNRHMMQDRQLLALPGGGRARRERRLVQASTDNDAPEETGAQPEFDPSFEPEEGEVVKYFHRSGLPDSPFPLPPLPPPPAPRAAPSSPSNPNTANAARPTRPVPAAPRTTNQI